MQPTAHLSPFASELSTPEQGPRLLVTAFTKGGVARTARPLRAKGRSVQTAGSVEAAFDLATGGRVDLLVVERDQGESQALAFLQRLRRSGCGIPCVLVTPAEGLPLHTVINEAAITRVVLADEDLGVIVDGILRASATPAPDPRERELLRRRNTALEEKIDRLVRESIQREGSARLLHDILVEIGQADGVKEIAGRCIARLVTMLRLDMAFVALGVPLGHDAARFFSFGFPRSIVDRLQNLSWPALIATLADNGDKEAPRSLLELIAEPTAGELGRWLQVEDIGELVLFPLCAQGTALGFLGLGAKAGRSLDDGQRVQLRPVAKQIAIAIENARLVDAAAAAEALASGVLRHLPSTAVVCDPSGHIVWAHDGALGLFKGRAVPKVKLADLLPNADADVLLRQVADVGRGADPICLRALRLRIGGVERLLNGSIARLPSRDVMINLEDVTGRESLAGDLRRARALTSSLFAHAPAGVLFLRHGGEIVDINGTACTMLGSARADLLGQRIGALFPDLWRAVAVDADGGRGEVTLRVGQRQDQQITVSFSATRLGRTGRPAGMLLQLQDVGELRALREELRRKDNLALMGQMVSYIAHEIKNPLFGISSAAQVLAREVGSDESGRLSGAMLSEIDRLSRLLEELLVFGSKRTIDKVAGDPTEICREIATIQSEPVSQQGVTLELRLIPPRTPVLFDPARLRQVVVNLVANAVEATPEGGSVLLETDESENDFSIRVTNSGEPIPEEARECIFDLFYSTKPRGSGLGLAICRKIVEDHGGQIEVECSAQRGTTFSVRIPNGQGSGGVDP